MSEEQAAESGCGCVVIVFMLAAFLFGVGIVVHAWRFAWRAWFGS